MILWALALGCSAPPEAPSPPPPAPPVPIAAPTGSGPSYVVRFPAPQTQYLEVEASLPNPDQGTLDVMMAVWTPGSYLIREYAQHVVDLEAHGARGPLDVRKTSKNRWTVQAQGEETVRVDYRVWSTERTVRSNLVESDLAVLNGAPTFVTVPTLLDQPHDVRFELPEGWSGVETALPAHASGEPEHYLAHDFDQLVDTPALLGNPNVHTFEVAGVPHSLVSIGQDSQWDLERATADLEVLVETQWAFWGGSLPYDRYLFLNAVINTRGGLEHLSSTLMMAHADQMLDESRYEDWLGLASHEFFHTWNAKRLRPEPLGPFDYEREVYTDDLWIVEGFTSYYDDLLLKRAGLLDQATYIGRLSDQIAKLQDTPGRLHQPLAQASFDSWVEFYRKDDNTSNTAISYYNKGAVVGFALDATIRRATGDARSLDDVMKIAYARHSQDRGYTPEEFRAIVEEVAGVDMDAWFGRSVDRAEPLELDEPLAWFGLKRVETTRDDQGWAGCSLDGANRVSGLDERGPAWASGLQLGDEILAMNGMRISYGDWSRLGKRHEPGDTLELLTARRGQLREVSLELGTAPAKVRVEIDRQANALMIARRKAWLSR